MSSFINLVKNIFTIEGVSFFLSEKLSQDSLEKFFGCQRQRGRTSTNPTCEEFCTNTQALHVVDTLCADVSGGNCRGKKRSSHGGTITSADLQPLLKRRRMRKSL